MGVGDEFHRREADAHEPLQTEEEILRLIRQTPDDGQKANLIAIYQVARTTTESAKILSTVTARLELLEATMDKHTTLVNKASGAWRGMALVTGLLVAVIGYIWLDTSHSLKDVIKDNGKQESAIQELRLNPPISHESDRRITVMEKAMTDILANQIDTRQHFSEVERALARLQSQHERK